MLAKANNKSSFDQYMCLIAPILSISILVLGMGSLTTFTTLRLDDFKVAEWLIGLISASYFVGLTAGGYKAQHLVLRVGHIRSYAAFSSIFAVSALLQGLFEVPWLWIPLRFCAGFCLAGCFLVIESWLLGASNRKNRGIILAIYMISYYAGQAVGQFFLSIPNLQPIHVYIIGALFFTFSILPVSTTRFHAPYAEEPNILSFRTLNQRVPVAIWGSLGAGFILATIYSLYPLYLSYNNWEQAEISIIMAFLLFGATAAQYPVGWLSDRYDRRLVLCIMLIICLLILIVIELQHDNFYFLLFYSAILGGASFTIYPMSINHGVDHFTSKDLISATAALMLAYGTGCVFGPSLTSLLMNRIGENGFVYSMLIMIIILCSYITYRIYKFDDMPAEEKSHYVPLPDTTVEVVQMDLEVKEKDIQARHISSIEKFS